MTREEDTRKGVQFFLDGKLLVWHYIRGGLVMMLFSHVGDEHHTFPTSE